MSLKNLVEERIPIQGRLPGAMPLNGINAPARRQGQEAERLYHPESEHKRLGRFLDELLFRQDVFGDHGVTSSATYSMGIMTKGFKLHAHRYSKK
jgi:hypothetical protein